jgi:hypothetical protein
LNTFSPAFIARARIAVAALMLAMLAGCGTFRSYNHELDRTLSNVSAGTVDAAIQTLESNNKGKSKDLLYYLELGELQRLTGRYQDSQKSWMAANEYVQTWEQTAQTDPVKFLTSTGSYLINDKLRPYEGHDYEKVMLLTNMALNYLALGEYDNARVAIKQTHELEAVIAELRSKQTTKAEEDAKEKGATTTFKELNGYPVQSIDSPAVNALKNSYQSALSHYLAGYAYEALGESGLAAAGYRFANELQPNQPALEEALRGLDQRVSAPPDGLTDVLFVIGSGTAPALQSRQFSVALVGSNTAALVPFSFPVMVTTSTPYMPNQISVDSDQSLAVTPITSIDLMARRALRDDMPGIILRATVRSAAKTVAQYGVQKQARKQNDGLLGLASVAMSIASAVTESADERTWRSLPSEIAIARGRLAPGTHTIKLQTPLGERSVQLNLVGRYAVIGLRLMRGEMFVQAPKVAALVGVQQAPVIQAAPALSTAGNPKTLAKRPHTKEKSK